MRFSANGLLISLLPETSRVARTYAEKELTRIAASVSLVPENWNTKIFPVKPLVIIAHWAQWVATVTHGLGTVAADLVGKVSMALQVAVNIVTGLWSIKTNQAPLVAKPVLKALNLTMDVAQRETADALEILA